MQSESAESESLRIAYRKEADFWADYDRQWLQYGLPYWIDYRHGRHLDTPRKFLWTDPAVDRILYGGSKGRLLASLPPGSKVLEVGCGAGWLALEMARNGHRVTAIDISEQRIGLAREQARKHGQEIRYLAGDINDLDGSESYDVVVSYGTIHHFPHLEKDLVTIGRLVAGDGRFIAVENCDTRIRKLAEWFRTSVLGKQPDSRSPFEDVASHLVVRAVRDAFEVREEAYSLAFAKIVAEALDTLPFSLPSALTHPFLKLIKALDSLAIRLGLMGGETVYMDCRKKKTR